MPSYKFYYFGARGLGEISRQLLHMGDQEYEDVRYTFESWPSHKDETPFGQLPVLEVDGKKIPQSFAIARFLARQFGYAGKNDFDAALVDALADQFKDYFAEIRGYYVAALEIFPGDKEATRPQGEAARLKLYPLLEKRLAESKSGFLVGDSLTWIDLFLADHVDILRNNIPGFLNEYPKVLAHSTKVRSDPKLKVWLDKRPATRF